MHYVHVILSFSRSQWLRGLRHRSAAARLLRSWVRIPPGAWVSVCCDCCVLSGRGHCDELATRPEESYLLWCVAVYDTETSSMRSKTKQAEPLGDACKQFHLAKVRSEENNLLVSKTRCYPSKYRCVIYSK